MGMTEKNDVIKHLEQLCDEIRTGRIKTASASYTVRRMDWIGDAIALLKTQEPVSPIVDVDEWKCGYCGHKLEHQELLGDNVLFHEQYDFCPRCGKKVKWDD